MLQNYICKITVSLTQDLQKSVAATAFGFNDGSNNGLLTAGHVITNLLGEYPTEGKIKAYITFQNYYGVVNEAPIEVQLILNKFNSSEKFGVVPLFDSAEILYDGVSPVTNYFKKADCNLNDDVIGIGYPSNSNDFINIAGSLTCIDGDRLLVNHDSFPGCSGCPYVKNIDGEYFVIGSLIGSIEGSDKHNSIQSANSFYLMS